MMCAVCQCDLQATPVIIEEAGVEQARVCTVDCMMVWYAWDEAGRPEMVSFYLQSYLSRRRRE